MQFLIDQINDLTLNVRAVFAGAETGVELADQLSEAMNLRTNGTAHSEERRNKFAMGEAVRNAGIVRDFQRAASSENDFKKRQFMFLQGFVR